MLGSCLIPTAAMMNHSCDDNTHPISQGPVLTVRSIRALKKNEELTITYINPARCIEERQEKLLEQYGFHCFCSRYRMACNDPREFLTGDKSKDQQIHKARLELSGLIDAVIEGHQDPEEAKTAIRKLCQEAANPTSWPIFAYPLPSVHTVLAEMVDGQNRWEKALKIRIKLGYLIDPLCYPEPLEMQRVQNLMDLCQLERLVFLKMLLTLNKVDCP